MEDIHPSRQSLQRKIRYSCLTDRVDNIFASFFFCHHVCACGILVPQAGIESGPSKVRLQES